jgi:hypothetical protein
MIPLNDMKPKHVLALYRIGRAKGRGLEPFLKHPRDMIELRKKVQRLQRSKKLVSK